MGQSGFQKINPDDLKDPSLFRLNQMLEFVHEQIYAVQGGSPEGYSFFGPMTFPQAYLTNEDVPVDAKALLTRAAGDKLYGPLALKNQITTGRFEGIPIGGLGTGSAGGGGAAPPVPAPTTVHVQYRSTTDYLGSVDRVLNEKLGEVVSVLDFGAIGNGTADDSGAFQNAVDALNATPNGGTILIPGCLGSGYYKISTPIEITTSKPIVFLGQGDASLVKRDSAATWTAGKGVFDITGSNVKFLNFQFDGAVTTAVGLLYTDFSSDPCNALLTNNTSFWIHGGSENIEFLSMKITHSGGYAIFADARTLGYIKNLTVRGCRFVYNRPHLFGTSSGDRNYGSWTGGIFLKADGITQIFSCWNTLIEGNYFYANTGNCVWSHTYDLNTMHRDLRVMFNSFLECGLDGILFGAVLGGCAQGNVFQRIGNVVTTDGGTPTPKWLANLNATALDTYYTMGVNYIGNAFMSTNGGDIDADGFGYGTISGNVCITPSVGDPSYVTDQISIYGPAANGVTWSYGVQVSNSGNSNFAGKNVMVTGNSFINKDGGAARMYASRGGYICGNNIDHPSNANVAPIILGNIGTTANLRSYNNVVKDNAIRYNPASTVCSVQENPNGFAFDPTDINLVNDNQLFGNTEEFFKDGGTASTTGIRVSLTTAGLTAINHNVFQRENTGAINYLRTYGVVGGTSVLLATLYDQGTIGAGTGSAMLNISSNGVDGSVTTGGRTTLLVDDTVATAHSYSDGFIAIADTKYSNANANLFPASVALFRYVSSTSTIEYSTSVSLGVRVWVPINSGSGTPGGSNKYVQYNNSGAFGGSINFQWDNATRVVTILGLTGTAGLAVGTSFIQSDEGFYSAGTSYQTVNIPNGGVYSRSGHFEKYVHIAGNAGIPTATTGTTVPLNGIFYYDTTLNKFRAYENSAWVDMIGGGSISGLTAGRMPYATGASTIANTVVYWDNANTRMGVNKAVPGTTLHVGGQGYFDGAASGAGLTCAAGYVESTEGFYSPFTSYQTFQAPSGGMYARSLRAIAYTQLGNNSGTPSVTSGDSFAAGAIHWDTSGTPALKVYNGSSWVALATGGITTINSQTGPTISINASGAGITVGSGGANIITIANTGVTSVAGTSNQVFVNGGTSAQTGAVTLSLPQNISTTSQPTFAGVISTVAFNANVTGLTTAFQNVGTSFIVNGNGLISTSAGMNVSGSSFVDASRNVSAGTITATGNIQCGSSSNYGVAGGFFGQDATGGLVCGSVTLYFKGGILYAYV